MIAAGPDGNMWFSNHFFDSIGRIQTDAPNAVTQFTFPTRYDGVYGGFAFGITAAPDGHVWFTESSVNRIGRIDVNAPNAIDEFPIPTGGLGENAAGAYELTVGMDGNLWFTEFNVNQIARIEIGSPNTITEFPIPTANSAPYGITKGPDGNLWFTETTGNKIGRISRFVPDGRPCLDDSNCENGSCVAGFCCAGVDVAMCAAFVTCQGDLGATEATLSQSAASLNQCQTDLGATSQALAQAQADLASATNDDDGDGIRDSNDVCAGTPAGTPVDQVGCSQEQFCNGIDVATSAGRRACKKADWRNDEPTMKSSEADCRVDRSALQGDRCVAVTP